MISIKKLDDLINGGYYYKHSKKSNIAIIFTHGFSGSPKELIPLSKFLHKLNIDVYVPRLPGHQTTIEDLDKQKYHSWINTAFNLYEYIDKNYSKVILMGFSMGGTISLNLAQKIKPYKIITLATPVDVWDFNLMVSNLEHNVMSAVSIKTILSEIENISKIEQFLKKKNCEFKCDKFSLFVNNIYRRIVHNAVTNKNANFNKYVDTYTSISYKATIELFKLMNITKKGLSKITSPILMIGSTKDDLVPLGNLDIISKNIKSKDVSKYIVDKSSHIMVLDDDLSIIKKRIKQFIDR